MRIPSKTEYAYKAVLALSRSYSSGKPLRINTIAEVYGISGKFLLQVMIQLKNAGIIQSIRGAAGGYILARKPSNITLKDVILAVDHALLDTPLDPSRKKNKTDMPLIEVFEEMSELMTQKLDLIDFEQLQMRIAQDEVFVYTI